jgi:uncharacterized protein (DUF2235 family)
MPGAGRVRQISIHSVSACAGGPVRPGMGAANHMSKRIVYCADGTWNNVDSDTNVYRISKACLTTPAQVVYYDDGVGADGNPLERLLGGALGDGLFKKIKDGYTKIAHTYDRDDEIFIFGFSRGAFTARSLAGMIAACGLPTGPLDPNDDSFVETVFQAYRDKANREALLATLKSKDLYDAKIKMIGVWDTVGALGLPAIVGGVDPLRYGFLDTTLHPDVLNACHALALDERRREFPATLWTGETAQGQTLEQVWFAGVHCDVGGGYPDTGLSDITFSWMMGKAEALGVEFDPNVWSQFRSIEAKHALGLIHESWNVGWLFPTRRQVPANSRLSNSVYIRCEYAGNYAPPNVQMSNGLPGPTYVQVKAVEEP